MSHRLSVRGLVVLGALALLTGCAPQAQPTPTPRFTSEAQAYQAAEDTYRAYVDALNNVDLSDPATFEEVYKWETGKALAADKKNLTRYHADGVTKTGRSVVRSATLRENGDKTVGIILNVCEDVSTIDLRDTNGRSLVKSSRPPVQALAVTFEASTTVRYGLAVAAVLGRKDGPAC